MSGSPPRPGAWEAARRAPARPADPRPHLTIHLCSPLAAAPGFKLVCTFFGFLPLLSGSFSVSVSLIFFFLFFFYFGGYFFLFFFSSSSVSFWFPSQRFISFPLLAWLRGPGGQREGWICGVHQYPHLGGCSNTHNTMLWHNCFVCRLQRVWKGPSPAAPGLVHGQGHFSFLSASVVSSLEAFGASLGVELSS